MKVTKVNNYWVQFEFASFKERQQLDAATSYLTPEAQFSSAYKADQWDGKKKFLTGADKLPIGLFKSIFPKHHTCYDENINLDFDDIPLYKVDPTQKKYSRRQYQLDAINEIFRHKRGIVAAVVGAGKTLIAAATISKHLEAGKKKVLFVCYDKNILSQTIKNFTSYGLKVSKFGDGDKDLSGDVVVATIQSLSRVEQPGKALSAITMCFCDESHHSKSRTSKDVLKKLKNCEYYIGLTATPQKPGTLELAELMCVLGPVIFTYGFTDGVAADSIAPVKCFFLRTPFSYEAADAVIFRKNYKYIWDGGIRDNEKRNKLIADILATLSDLIKTPSLVMVDKTEHGIKIAEQMEKTPLNFLQMYGEDSILVRDMKKEYLMKNEVNALISTIVKEGVDFKISPVIALNAAGRKSFISQIQFLGRIVRKNERFGKFRAYIDFIDTCHPKLAEHSMERIQSCEDIGAEVVIVNTVNELLQEVINHYRQTCGND